MNRSWLLSNTAINLFFFNCIILVVCTKKDCVVTNNSKSRTAQTTSLWKELSKTWIPGAGSTATDQTRVGDKNDNVNSTPLRKLSYTAIRFWVLINSRPKTKVLHSCEPLLWYYIHPCHFIGCSVTLHHYRASKEAVDWKYKFPTNKEVWQDYSNACLRVLLTKLISHMLCPMSIPFLAGEEQVVWNLLP